MIIREAEPKEINNIYLIVKVGSFLSGVQPPTLEEMAKVVAGQPFWVANNPIFGLQGCVGLKVCSSGLAEINYLHVLPDFRNERLGPELVKVALEEAGRLNITEVLASPNAAADLKLWSAKFPNLKVTDVEEPILQPKLQHGGEKLCQQ